MEKTLMEQLGMNVAMTHKEGETGQLVVRYKTLDQLEFLCRRLQGIDALRTALKGRPGSG
jgi:hypothetical protein